MNRNRRIGTKVLLVEIDILARKVPLPRALLTSTVGSLDHTVTREW
jgi:hypothetical protein